MPVMEFDNSLTIGHELIDEHHKTLVAIINMLHDALIGGVEQKYLHYIFNEFNEYISYYFSEEEIIMCDAMFEMKDEHITEHGSFLGRLSKFSEEYLEKEDLISNRTIDWLVTWLTRHIFLMDTQHVVCLSLIHI